jgi:uncharacterized protein (TIGR03066 family)
MRVLGSGLLLCALLILVGCGKGNNTSKTSSTGGESGGTKTNADKIIGTWEVTKDEEKGEDVPPGNTIEFIKDGNLKIVMKLGEKEMKMDGTYKVEDDKLSVTLKGPDKKARTETATIDQLTDTVMVTKDKNGKKTEYKKKT